MPELITFDSVVIGQTSFGFDGNDDGIADVVFTTTDPFGFNILGPGPNQTYIQEPGLEGTSLLRTDLTVNFIEGATDNISFGFALNSFNVDESYAVEVMVFDEDDNLLASKTVIGDYTSTPIGFSSFPEGQVNVSFSGTASYMDFSFTAGSGRFIIDNFEGEFGSSPEPFDEITVFDLSPYDGEIMTRGIPGIDATFGYSFSGTEIYAEFIVRNNMTLEEAAESGGFEYFNFMQIVTEFPGGIFSGCLGNVPFADPPQGGCIIPYIKADDQPFYYDVGSSWVGTEFYYEDYTITGIDRSSSTLVDVGFRFSDQPFSPYASASNPMSFVLFPVGVYADGTYEILTTEALYWQSTNNFFGGSAGEASLSRANPVDDGLDETILTGQIAPLTDLSAELLGFLQQTGLVGIELNSPPEANNDAFSANEDSVIFGNVLLDNGNGADNDPDGDPLAVSLVSGPDEGILVLNGDGTFTYEADADAFDVSVPGTQSVQTFTYQVDDGKGGSAQATATLTVQILNDGQVLTGTNKPDNLVGDRISDGAEDVIRGGNGNDVIKGLDGADTLYGENGDDKLYGGESIDRLFGGNGNDLLDGGDGNDFLYGERGDDTLTGGLGRDQFWFGKSGGTDTITDFTVREDLICVSGIKNATSFAAVAITQVGANTVLDMGGTHAILSGIESSVLTADDFLFA